MKVSVIIPLYNGAEWIKETIASVLRQEILPKEIIVVDDSSTDNSVDIVRNNFPQVKLLYNPRKGSSAARNFGLLHMQANFVAFLDQDDLWHPLHLKLLLDSFKRHPEAGAIFTEVVIFERGEPLYTVSPIKESFFDPWENFPFTVGIAGPSVAVFKKVAVENIGMWDERATGMGDPLLFLKLSVVYPLLKISVKTVGKRVHPRQQWLNVRSRGENYLVFRKKVMQLALDFLKKHMPNHPKIKIYEKRLNVLDILKDLVIAVKNNNFSEIPTLSSNLERLLHSESLNLIKHAFYCLTGALFPVHSKELLYKQRKNVFKTLLRVWDKKAPKTRMAIELIIEEEPYIT